MNRKKLWVGYAAFVIGFGLLCYMSLFEYLQQGTLFAKKLDGNVYISDFVNTYSASKLAYSCISGAKVSIYDPHVQDALVRKLVAPVVPEAPFYSQYPPYYFALVLPLSLLSLTASWMVYSGLGLIGAFFAFRYAADGLSKEQKAAAIGLSLFSYPMWLSTQLGQQSLILLPCVAAFWFFLQKRKPLAAGVVAAIASVKLQYLPGLFVVGLMAGGAQFVVGLAGTLLLMCLYAVGILGINNVIDYPTYLVNGERSIGISGVNVYAMQNLRKELFLFAHGDVPIVHTLTIMFFAVSMIVLGWLWWQYRVQRAANDKSGSESAEDENQSDFKLLGAFSMLIFILFGVHAHTQDYLLALFASIWLWSYAEAKLRAGERSRRLRFISWSCVLFPVLSWFWFPNFVQMLLDMAFLPPFFVWGVLLSLVVAGELRQRLLRSKRV